MTTASQRLKLGLAGILLVAASAGAVLAVAGTAKATVELFSRENYGNEGTLVLAPSDGPRPQLLKLVEPGVMSIVFADEATARDFYAESASLGERVCLADLGPQTPQHHGQRWWLFTC